MRFVNMFLTGVLGTMAVLVLSSGVAQATPCNGTDMSGLWADIGDNRIYSISQQGCDQFTFSTGDGRVSGSVSTSGSAQQTFGSDIITGLLHRSRGYSLADSIDYTATFSTVGRLSVDFTANRRSRGGARSKAIGTATVDQSFKYIDFSSGRSRFVSGGDRCGRGQIFKAPSLVFSATISSTQGGYESVLDDARRELQRQHISRTQIDRALPRQIRGLSGTRTLVKVSSEGQYMHAVVGQCVDAAEARADEARRSSGAAPAATSAKD